MTIIEVLKIDKKELTLFKRPKHINWLWCDHVKFYMLRKDSNLNFENYTLTMEDLLATDWDFKSKKIWHLFNKSDDTVYASLNKDALDDLGHLRYCCGLQTGWQLVPLNYLIEGAYII